MEEEYKKLYNNGELELWCTSCKEVRKHTEYLDRREGYLQGVICNECGEVIIAFKEPVKCSCGCDNFGIEEVI